MKLSTPLFLISIPTLLLLFFYLHSSPEPPPQSRTHLSSPTHHGTQIPTHPLDPLTHNEISTVRSILSSYPPFSPPSPVPSIHSLSLQEPEKSLVLSWSPRQPLPGPRLASVQAYTPGRSHLLSLNLTSRRVISHVVNPQPSGYPGLTSDDMLRAMSAALAHPDFLRALRARNLDPAELTCGPLSPGWYGREEEGYRAIKVECYALKGSPNFYMRPVEGLVALVDLDSGRVIRISNRDLDVPVDPGYDTDYRYQTQKNRPAPYGSKVNPVSMEPTRGRSFTVDAHMVKWAGWEFHLKPDARAGMVVSRVRFADPDTGEVRDVMYKGMVSELFVPYMDPSEGWYFKTYMDAGEYGLGMSAMPLVRLNDCPRDAYYMNAVFTGPGGDPFVREDVVCMFERYEGDVAWRHSETFIPNSDVRSI